MDARLDYGRGVPLRSTAVVPALDWMDREVTIISHCGLIEGLFALPEYSCQNGIPGLHKAALACMSGTLAFAKVIP